MHICVQLVVRMILLKHIYLQLVVQIILLCIFTCILCVVLNNSCIFSGTLSVLSNNSAYYRACEWSHPPFPANYAALRTYEAADHVLAVQLTSTPHLTALHKKTRKY